MRRTVFPRICGTTASLAAVATIGFNATTVYAATDAEVEALRQQLQEQQKLLEQLQRQLAEQQALTQRIIGKGKVLEEEVQQAERDAIIAKQAAESKQADRDVRESVQLANDQKVQIVLSGQVNRMMTVADDGKDTTTFYTDNDASNSRLRIVGTAPVNDDLTIGSRIEFAVAPDESGKVSQDQETTGDFWDQRWAEVYLSSKRFGKLSLGKGDTASNNSAEVDLSKTDVIQYASIADVAGGLKFRDGDDQLTDIKVADVFQDEDGLSRASRVRYDTPTWNGFYLAASAVSDSRWDGSAWWSGKLSGFSAAGAFAVADRGTDSEDLRYDSSFSILHDETGLNFTISGALTERPDDSDSTNFYAKLGWIGRWFSVGPTALGIDYTKAENEPSEAEDGDSISFAVVQQFEKHGTELYAIVRNFSVDSDEQNDLEDITIGSVGARVKF